MNKKAVFAVCAVLVLLSSLALFAAKTSEPPAKPAVDPAANSEAESVAKSTVDLTKVPTIADILASWKKQNDVDIELKFTYTFSLPSETGKKSKVPMMPPSMGASSDPQYASTYIRTPEVIYQRSTFGSTGVVEEHSSPRNGIYNLTECQLKMTMPDGKWRGSTRTDNPFVGWSGTMGQRPETLLYPLDPRKDDIKTNTLIGWLKYGVVSARPENIGNTPCWKVVFTETKDSSIKRMELWVDPALGYSPKMLKETGGDDKSGDWSRVTEWLQYKEIGEEIWFPMRLLITMNWVKGDIINQKSAFDVIEITTEKKHNKADLKLSFPPERKVPSLSVDAIDEQQPKPEDDKVPVVE